MGKNFENKSVADSATLEIASEAVEGLMRSVRWTENMAAGEANADAADDALQTLLQRPRVAVQSIDITPYAGYGGRYYRPFSAH